MRKFLNTTNEPIAAAVVNPPYNRFQNISLPDKLNTEIAHAPGRKTSGLTNLYALFIYKVISRLQTGGRAAFIVPSEFLATGYGAQVKSFICSNRRLSKVVIFDTNERIFPDASTTACVLLFDGKAQEHVEFWRLSGESDAEVFQSLCGEVTNISSQPITSPSKVSYDTLDPKENWQGVGQGDKSMSGFVPLSVFGRVKRGLATGANEFFLLKQSDVYVHEIPNSNLIECIPSAASAPSIVFDQAQINKLRTENKLCFLFNGMGGKSHGSSRYILLGESQKIDQRYLTKSRSPWYRLESRDPAPLLLAVFGRGRFRACLNLTDAINLTAFHGFYPKPEFVKLVSLIWLYLQTPMAQDEFLRRQRGVW